MPKCRKKCQILKKNDLNRPEKARRIEKISKFCFKLPRIDMENSVVGKNCKKHLKKSSKICLLNA